jgi:assimilatory nitrate reductase electron transfer subunit
MNGTETRGAGSPSRRRVVVVGNGMAGARVVEEIRARDPGVAVTVFGAEPDGAYNRILLSNVLAGQARVDDIALTTARWYHTHEVDLRLGVEVTGIDRTARVVHSGDGRRVRYDVLVLATGSRPVVPPVGGLRDGTGRLLPGAHVFRTLDDCRRLVAAAGEPRPAVVVGGGLLGLEAARGLAGRGLPVRVVHRAAHLMERQLDPLAGAVLARTVRALGIDVHLGTTVTRVRAAGGRVAAVELADGGVIECELLVFACGVEPETGLAAAAGLRVDRGIVVDEQLRSVTDPHVFALGECAQHDGVVYGLVAPAWEQANVVADVVTGARPDAAYGGSRLVTRLQVNGVQLASMGDVAADGDGLGADLGGTGEPPGDAEVMQFVDPTRGTYKKLVIRKDRLVGAILLGDVSTVGTVTQAFDRGRPLPADRLPLLFTGIGTREPAVSPALLPADAKVCVCNAVTKATIVDCVLAGARCVDEVAARTRSTTGCGSCRDAVAGIVEWVLDAEPAPA